MDSEIKVNKTIKEIFSDKKFIDRLVDVMTISTRELCLNLKAQGFDGS